MKINLDKIKQFIIKYDELFFVIVFFLINFGMVNYLPTIPEDELWNFQNIYKMYNGYKIYIDANVITTPLFHVIGFYIFKLFGANFFIFRLYGIIINTCLIFESYKMFKILLKSKISSIFLTILLFMLGINLFNNIPNYNNLCLIIAFYGILSILNRKKYTDGKFIIVQSLVIFLILLTKQNIGIFYIIGFISYFLLYEKNNKKIINLLKIVTNISCMVIIFIGVLYKYDLLNGFIDYTILGMKEFSNRNIYFENSAMIKLIGILFIFIVVICLIKKMKNVEKNKIFNINILLCFAIPFLITSYPLFNHFHVDVGCFFMYLLFLYVMYDIVFKDIFNKKIIYKISATLIIIMIIITIIKSFIYIYNLDYKYIYNDIYFGAVLSDELKNKIYKVTNYISTSDENIIILSTDAALYMMPLNISNGSMDVPLLGNFGKDGEEGVIDEIKNMKHTKIMINKEKKSYQESYKIIQYIKDNLIYEGKIEDFLVFVKEEK